MPGSSSEGGFFDTSDDHETLITRPRDLQDNATPSGNAMAVTALLKLASLTNELGDGPEKTLGGTGAAVILCCVAQ